MTDLDPHKALDPGYLYLRTDEKYEEVSAQMHDIQITITNVKTAHDDLKGRVNDGVSVRGKENAAAIAVQETKLAVLTKDSAACIQDVSGIKDQISNRDTGLFKQIADLGDDLQKLKDFVAATNSHLENTDVIVGAQDKKQMASDTFDSHVKLGMMVTVFLSIFATVMAFLWNYKGSHP